MKEKKRINQQLEDVKYLQKNLEKIHFDLYRNVHKVTLTSSLEKTSNEKSNFFKFALQESLALIGDAHTYIPGLLNDAFLPISLTEISGKFYITGASKDHLDLVGDELKAVVNHPIKDILPKISKLSSNENSEVLLKDQARYIPSIGALQYYGFIDRDNFKVFTDKNKIEVNKNCRERVKLRKPLEWRGEALEDSTGNEIYRFKIEGDTLVFQYNSCTNEGYTKEELKEFKDEILERIKSVKNVVVDLRQNSGGNTSVMQDLFKRFPQNKDLYVAMGRKTFSSGIHHLLYLKREKGAILVGENAGQKPNRFGDHKLIKLPNSNIRVHTSYKYFELLPGEDLQVIEPDIDIPLTIEDYVNETDPLDTWLDTL